MNSMNVMYSQRHVDGGYLWVVFFHFGWFFCFFLVHGYLCTFQLLQQVIKDHAFSQIFILYMYHY